ncbi:hypothetical protein ACHAWF_005308, partial [Thalassiosira exigua]
RFEGGGKRPPTAARARSGVATPPLPFSRSSAFPRGEERGRGGHVLAPRGFRPEARRSADFGRSNERFVVGSIGKRGGFRCRRKDPNFAADERGREVEPSAGSMGGSRTRRAEPAPSAERGGGAGAREEGEQADPGERSGAGARCAGMRRGGRCGRPRCAGPRRGGGSETPSDGARAREGGESGDEERRGGATGGALRRRCDGRTRGPSRGGTFVVGVVRDGWGGGSGVACARGDRFGRIRSTTERLSSFLYLPPPRRLTRSSSPSSDVFAFRYARLVPSPPPATSPFGSRQGAPVGNSLANLLSGTPESIASLTAEDAASTAAKVRGGDVAVVGTGAGHHDKLVEEAAKVYGSLPSAGGEKGVVEKGDESAFVGSDVRCVFRVRVFSARGAGGEVVRGKRPAFERRRKGNAYARRSRRPREGEGNPAAARASEGSGGGFAGRRGAELARSVPSLRALVRAVDDISQCFTCDFWISHPSPLSAPSHALSGRRDDACIEGPKAERKSRPIGNASPRRESGTTRPALVSPNFSSHPPPATFARAPCRRIRYDSHDTATVALAFSGASWTDPKALPLALMTSLLGSYDKSAGLGRCVVPNMCQEVAEHDLARSISSFSLNYSDAGLFGVLLKAPDNKLDDLLWFVMPNLVRLAHGFSDEELLRAKAHLKARILSSIDGDVAAGIETARQIQTIGRVASVAETMARVDALDQKDVTAAASEVVDDQDHALAAIGGVHELPDYQWIRRHSYMLRY